MIALSQNESFSSSNITFQEYIERVKSANPIEEVISEYVELKKNKALCPFHDEHTASFSVNIRGQYFNCFGCHSAGNIIHFIEKIEKIDFKEALKLLARRAGISPYQWTQEDENKFKQRKRKKEILQETAYYYHQKLNSEARNYLNGRGFNDEILKKYLIGRADGGLKDDLLRKGYGLEECQEAGVIKYTAGQYVDYFTNRIIIPNIVRGNVVHLSGRTLNKEEPKYLHIPGTIEYLWSETNFINQDIIIVEAPFDAISLIEWGYNAVALFGCGLKDDFVSRLLKAKSVTFLFDEDKAGIKGAEKSGRKLCQIARLANLPDDGKDPADYFKEGKKEVVDQAIQEAKDYIHCQIDKISDRLSVSKDVKHSEIIRHLSPVLEILSELEDSALVEGYFTDIKEKFKLSADEIKKLKKSVKDLQENSNKGLFDSFEEEEIEEIALLPGIVVDICVDAQGRVGFITIKEGKPAFELEIRKDGKVYLPPPNRTKTIPWLLPRFEEIKRYFKEDNDQEVFKAVEQNIRTYVELPDNRLYPFSAAWVIHTHLLEQASYTPILLLYSYDGEFGKTTFGKVLIFMSRSGEFTETLSEANIIRKAKRFEASFFIDVKDVWKKAERKESEDILLSRYERGHVVPRVLNPDKRSFEDTEHFNIFGPMIIASNEPAHHLLESRGVVITLNQSEKEFPECPKQEYFLPLKERLTALHVRWFGKTLPEVKRPAKRRLGDILKPILQVLTTFAPKEAERFPKIVSWFEKLRIEAKTDSLDGQVIQALLEIEKDTLNAGEIETNKIAEKVNHGKSAKYHVTSISLGKKLRSYGFEDSKRLGNHRTIKKDEKFDQLLEKLSIKYGLAPKESGESGLSDASSENSALEDAKCNAESKNTLSQSGNELTSKPNINSSQSNLAENRQTGNSYSTSTSSDTPDEPDDLVFYEVKEREAIQQEGEEEDECPFE